MEKFASISVLLSVAIVAGCPTEMPHISNPNNFTLLSRTNWHAKPPKLVEPLAITPTPFVVIHHSYIPASCSSRAECIAAMQTMQEMHQDKNGWNDIGYSFVVGGENDGVAYTGRGWSSVGAHAPHYNDKSIGICLIGDWTNQLPPSCQLETVRNLIQFGVKFGYIDAGYRLIGHRQVRKGTECPGSRLFEELETWPHFDSRLRL